MSEIIYFDIKNISNICQIQSSLQRSKEWRWRANNALTHRVIGLCVILWIESRLASPRLVSFIEKNLDSIQNLVNRLFSLHLPTHFVSLHQIPFQAKFYNSLNFESSHRVDNLMVYGYHSIIEYIPIPWIHVWECTTSDENTPSPLRWRKRQPGHDGNCASAFEQWQSI